MYECEKCHFVMLIPPIDPLLFWIKSDDAACQWVHCILLSDASGALVMLSLLHCTIISASVSSFLMCASSNLQSMRVCGASCGATSVEQLALYTCEHFSRPAVNRCLTVFWGSDESVRVNLPPLAFLTSFAAPLPLQPPASLAEVLSEAAHISKHVPGK